MEKRYQVFVSSTYKDLKDERLAVSQTVLEMGHFPTGMEIFPAIDEDQWEFIKKIIDNSDYYILLIGGRYGSLSSEGISYTEKEFDYAVSKSIRVLAFVHESPEDLPLKNSETDDELRKKLDIFTDKVKHGRLVKFWKNSDELPGKVALSLSSTINTFPAVGWVRGGRTANAEILEEVNNLRKRNNDLENQLDKILVKDENEITNFLSKNLDINDLVSLSDDYLLKGRFHDGNYHASNWEVETNWGKIFHLIGPKIFDSAEESTLGDKIAYDHYDQPIGDFEHVGLSEHTIFQIKLQLLAMGLIVTYGEIDEKGNIVSYWKLSPFGINTYLDSMLIRKSNGE